jgi:hypothetical protein
MPIRANDPSRGMSSTVLQKTVTEKPRVPSPKLPTKKNCATPRVEWTYVAAGEWAQRQTREEEFRRHRRQDSTHLGPRSARACRPVSPTPPGFDLQPRDLTTSPSTFPPPTGRGVAPCQVCQVYAWGVTPTVDGGACTRGGSYYSR